MSVANDIGSSVREDSESQNISQGNIFDNDRLSGLATLLVASGDNGVPALSFPATLTGKYGSLELHADGSYKYTLKNSLPAVQELSPWSTVVDVFTYTVLDNGVSDTATLSIPVNGSAPTAIADTSSVVEFARPATTGNVLANDLSVGETLQVVGVVNPVTGAVQTDLSSAVQGIFGKLVLHADGSYAYALDDRSSPDPLGTVYETFTYIVSDGEGNTREASADLVLRVTSEPEVLVTFNDIAIKAGETFTFSADTFRLVASFPEAVIKVFSVDFFVNSEVATIDGSRITIRSIGSPPPGVDTVTLTAKQDTYLSQAVQVFARTSPDGAQSFFTAVDVLRPSWFSEIADAIDFNVWTPDIVGPHQAPLLENSNKYSAGAGNDYIVLPNAVTSVHGGWDEQSVFMGGDGEDTIVGGDRDDRIDGGPGKDTIYGGAGSNKIWTGTGNDTVKILSKQGDDNEITLQSSESDVSTVLLQGDGDYSIHAGDGRIDLNASGTGVVTFEGDFSGRALIADGQGLDVIGDVLLENERFVVRGGASVTITKDLRVASTASQPDVVVTSGGSLALGDADADADQILISAGRTLSGHGSIAAISIVNQGEVRAEGGKLSLTGQVRGDGTYEIGAQGRLEIDGTFIGTVTSDADGGRELSIIGRRTNQVEFVQNEITLVHDAHKDNPFKITISGNTNDKITGGKGADVIIGSPGNDNLSGGEGKDTFDYRALDASALRIGTIQTLNGGSNLEADPDELQLAGSPNDYRITVEFDPTWERTVTKIEFAPAIGPARATLDTSEIEKVTFKSPVGSHVNLGPYTGGSGIVVEMARLSYEVYGPPPPAQPPTLERTNQLLADQTDNYLDISALARSRGWHALSAIELGIKPADFSSDSELQYSFVNGFYAAYDPSTPSIPIIGNDIAQANAMVLVGSVNNHLALTIAFLGTDQKADFNDYLDFDQHYNKYRPLIDAVKQYIQDPANGIREVLVTGHSLGGGMAQMLLREDGFTGTNVEVTEDNPYTVKGYTFGSPGADLALSHLSDPRIINYIHTDDLVPLAGNAVVTGFQVGVKTALINGLKSILGPAAEVLGSQINVKWRAGQDVRFDSVNADSFGTSEHEMSLYFKTMKRLASISADVNGPLAGNDMLVAFRNGVTSYAPDFELSVGSDESDESDVLVDGTEREFEKAKTLLLGHRDQVVLAAGGDDQIRMGFSSLLGSPTSYWKIDGGLGTDRLVIRGLENSDLIQQAFGSGYKLQYDRPILGASDFAEVYRVELLVLPDTTDGQRVQPLGGGEAIAQVATPGVSTFVVNSSFDYADAGDGAMSVLGTAKGDIVVLGAGSKTVNAGDGHDIVFAKSGITGPADILTLNGEGGDDFLQGGSGDDTLSGGEGNDTLHGGGGADVLTGGAGNDLVVAGAGNDIVIAGSGEGDDAYDGGDNEDTIVYSSTTLGVDVDLQSGIAIGEETGTDSLANIENVVGGRGDDRIIGDDSDNKIEGAEGDDEINGGVGLDTAVYRGSSAGYSIVLNADTSVTITDINTSDGDEGSDTLVNVELASFAGNGAVVALKAIPATISGTRAGSVTEDATLTAVGQFTITDPNEGEAGFQAGTKIGAFGSLTLDAAGAWTYTLNNSAQVVQGLRTGQTLTETIAIQSIDGSASDIVITINGADDTPHIAGTVLGAAEEDNDNTAGGSLVGTDPDTGTTFRWSIVGGTTSEAADYTFSLDNLHLVRNGVTILNDDFSDGVPPPSLSGGNGPTAYGVAGGFREANGRLIFDSALAVPASGAGTTDPLISQAAAVATNIQPGATNGLRQATAFTLEGLFDLILPDSPRETYGIRLSDRVQAGGANDQPGDNVIDLSVRQNVGGQTQITFRHVNFAGDQTTVLAAVALNPPPGTDQILLRLDHAADATFATASFDYLSGGVKIGGQALSGAGVLFEGEDWTRAQVLAFTPSITDSTLAGTYGTLTINQAGAWNYTLADGQANVQALASGQVVTDQFVVELSDGQGGTTSQAIAVNVTGVNDAPTLANPIVDQAMTEGQLFTFAVPGGTFADVDAGDARTLSATLSGNHPLPAWITFDPLSGAFSATPSFSDAGEYSITVTATDGSGASVSAAFLLTVVDTPPANAPPQITSNGGGLEAAISINENELNVTFVTAADADGDVLTYRIAGGADADQFVMGEQFVAGEKRGVLIFNGAPDYDSPIDANQDNVYEVVVEVSDGKSGTDTQAISVTVENVEEAPTALGGTATTNQGAPVTIPLADLISDPETVDADLSIVAVSDQGSVVVNGTDLVFTPNADFDGEAAVFYTVSDPSQLRATAVIRVTVSPVAGNQPPVADADGPYVAIEDELLQVSAADGVLAGDTDPENGSLTAELVSSTSNGTVTLNSDGSFNYQPNLNFDGSDSFVYRARDAGGLTSAEVTVQINMQTVNDAASITGEDSGAIEEDASPSTVSGDLDVTDVDSPATFKPVSNSATSNGYGTFSINADGLWTYALDNTNAAVNALNDNDELVDRFTVQTADGTTKVVNITIKGNTDAAPNHPPTVSGPVALAASNEDAARTITAAELLANATDPDGDAMMVAGVRVSRGVIAANGNGTWTFTPAANDDTSVVFTYQVTDGASAPVAAMATLDLLPINDSAVIAGARTGSVTEDAQLTATGLLTVSDHDASEASFRPAVIAGTYGMLTLAANGSWTYALDNASAAVQGLVAAQSVPETFTVQSADGTTAVVTITVRGANEGTANVINGTNKGEVIKGTSGADVITALKGSDIVNARDGDDVIKATIDDGNDFYYGDGGSDTVDYSALTKGVDVCLQDLFGANLGIVTGKQSGNDVLVSIENVIGSQAADKIDGSDLANMLVGGGAADTINGRGGKDIIEGGAGNDVLTGGSGIDAFVFKPGFGNDRLTDFDANPAGGQDFIDLTAFGIGSAAEFAQRVEITDIGAHTLVTIDGAPDQTLRLDGISNATTVTVDDFRFL